MSYISVRAALTLITSLFISMIIGRRIIGYLQKQQIGETTNTKKDKTNI